MQLDLTQLRKLHENATPGPWNHDSFGLWHLFGMPVLIDSDPANRALIAYVRTHLPEIIERLERIK